MKKISFLLLLLFILSIENGFAQCTIGQKKIKVVLKTDNFPLETNWTVVDNNNIVIWQSPVSLIANTLYMDSICVASNICHQFKITDQAGDGICCGVNGNGYFEVYYDNVLVKKDSSFGVQSTVFMGCPAGANCGTAITATQGQHTAPAPNTWYKFIPPTTGFYTVSTCSLANTCNTKLWMYDYCTNLVPSNGNAATIYYAENNCGIDATINAYLVATKTYYIRVGDENGSCAGIPINWSVNYNGTVTGCLDTIACNFNPFATISDPSSCIYYPSPLCPTGSDLTVDSQRLSTTIQMDTMTSSSLCTVREGCMNGYGPRELVRFDTKISNIGATDFYAGTPPPTQTAYNPIYEWDQCHGHWHFEDYAEYLLADSLNNFIPIGYKNGFCVLDLTCTTGSAKFGCSNMGITAGCADIYASYLDCQWIDITEIPDGNYKLLLRANWIPRPDFYGRYETDYVNNWARACIKIYHDATNTRQVQVLPNCAPYVDCNGVTNGLSVKDCDGVCNGTRLTGDVNLDQQRNNADISNYMTGSIYYNMPATKCNDLNDDGQINVTDATLLYDCVKHGPGTIPAGHSHEPCRFPDKIKNPFQQADFSIGNIDYLAKTVDVFIKNANSKILSYQLKLKGLTLSAVQNGIPTYNPSIQFRPTGEIIVLTNNEVPIPKNLATTTLLRVKYSSINSNKVCIENVVAVVNEAYEEITHNIVDSACITTIPTPSDVETAEAGRRHSLYPNPFNRSTTLVMETASKELYEVAIYDMFGRVVRNYPQQRNEVLVIEKNELAPGMYFLKVSGDSWQFKEKLLIQ